MNKQNQRVRITLAREQVFCCNSHRTDALCNSAEAENNTKKIADGKEILAFYGFISRRTASAASKTIASGATETQSSGVAKTRSRVMAERGAVRQWLSSGSR